VGLTLVLAGVTSPHRLVESVRVAYGFRGVSVDAFVVVRATGMAAQAGVPEAYKVALRYGKPLIVLPSTKDLLEYVRFEEVYSVVPGSQSSRSIEEVRPRGSCALIFSEEGGRVEVPSEVISIPELPPEAPPQVAIAVTLYVLSRSLKASGGPPQP